MALKLIKGNHKYKEQIIDMLKEWKEYNDTHDTNHSPWVIFKNDFDDFDYYLRARPLHIKGNNPLFIVSF